MENVNNIILEQLRAIRGDIGYIKDDMREVKNRLANLESGQGAIMQQIGHQSSTIAQNQLSYDRVIERIEKLEKRLEIVN